MHEQFLRPKDDIASTLYVECILDSPYKRKQICNRRILVLSIYWGMISHIFADYLMLHEFES